MEINKEMLRLKKNPNFIDYDHLTGKIPKDPQLLELEFRKVAK